jgi:hypothetical protein
LSEESASFSEEKEAKRLLLTLASRVKRYGAGLMTGLGGPPGLIYFFRKGTACLAKLVTLVELVGGYHFRPVTFQRLPEQREQDRRIIVEIAP